MPPKKNVDKTGPSSKNPDEKAPRKKIRKEKPPKPKLKTPSILRIKLPPIKSLLNTESTNSQPDTSVKKRVTAAEKRKLNNAQKLDLANEVALAQIIKRKIEPEVKEEPSDIKEEIPEPQSVVKKKRQYRKRIPVAKVPIPEVPIPKVPIPEVPIPEVPIPEVPIPQVAETTESIEDFELKKIPPKKVNIIRRGRGRTNNLTKNKKEEVTVNSGVSISDNNNSTVTNKRKADSTSRIPLKRPKAPKTDTTKNSVPVRLPLRPRRYNKGKIEAMSTTVNQSPSILITEPRNKTKTSFQPNVMVEVSPLIASRKSSMTSVSECLSWTKDISSSSTTTCVTVESNDFFRFNKKLPIVKLANIDHKLKGTSTVICNREVSNDTLSSPEKSESSSSSDSSSDISELSNSLNLSSSSVFSPKTPAVDQSVLETSDEYNKISYSLDKLSVVLKKIDFEIINWIGYGNDNTKTDLSKVDEKILNEFQHERDIIIYCQDLKQILADSDQCPKSAESYHNNYNNPKHPSDELNLNQSRYDNSPLEGNEYFSFTNNSKSPLKSVSNYDYLEENTNFTVPMDRDQIERTETYEQSYLNNDDDDALSLFAESLTGMESSRFNSSMSNNLSSEVDEYVPQPVNKNNLPQQTISYFPTKISDETDNSQKSKTVCEKQNADSTSIYKDADQIIKLADNIDVAAPGNTAMPPPEINRVKLSLIALKYKPQSAVKSIVFKGVCFFNLISNCRKSRCMFPHIQIPPLEIRNKLSKLSEDLFIQEYMLMRNYPILRRLYGIFYVEECIQRRLTRVIVEMALDYIMKENGEVPEDAIMKVEVVENALIHLNDIDLKVCEDILRYSKGPMFLCDIFINMIAETQNFSRFKQIFIKLAHFIVDNKRTFSFETAKHILERVCILPFELRVAEAMILIIKNTDVKIFKDSMMEFFENVLLKFDVKLYDELISHKQHVMENPPEMANAYVPPMVINQDLEQMTLSHSDRERYTSPDTTKLDTLNKAIDDPAPMGHALFVNKLAGASCSLSNDSDEYQSTPTTKFKTWRPSPYNSHHNSHLGRVIRTQMKRNTEHQNVYGTQAKFPRIPGPDMF